MAVKLISNYTFDFSLYFREFSDSELTVVGFSFRVVLSADLLTKIAAELSKSIISKLNM